MFETDTVLPPDPVIEAYKKDVDRTLIRENLKLSFEQRLANLERLEKFANEMRQAVIEANKRPKDFEAIAELEAIREEQSRPD
jgi:hypothetical protein